MIAACPSVGATPILHVPDALEANLQTGKYWGNANLGFSTGNRLSPDSRLHQNGPAFDGWVNPAAGRAGAPRRLRAGERLRDEDGRARPPPAAVGIERLMASSHRFEQE
jgi:hypothetical protein